MKKTLEIVVPAACSIVPGSAWADEPTFKKCGAVIPALIRSTAAHLCECLGSPCRVRVGPEVRFEEGSVRFLVVLDFKEEHVDINLEALKKALEAKFAGVLEQEDGFEDQVAATRNATDVFEGGESTATANEGCANEREMTLGVDAAINADPEGASPAQPRLPPPGDDQAFGAGVACLLGDSPQVVEDGQPHQVFFPIADALLDDDPPLEEVVEICERVVGVGLVGHGFPMALIRSAKTSEDFPAGENLSNEMSGAHIRTGGLWILEKVTVTE